MNDVIRRNFGGGKMEGRCWIMDVECWKMDDRCWMLDVGCWRMDVGCWRREDGGDGCWMKIWTIALRTMY